MLVKKKLREKPKGNQCMYSFIAHNNLLINEAFFDFLESFHLADFQSLEGLEGGILLKKNEFRSVTRIERGDKVLYLKRHFWPLKERINAIIPFAKKEDARNEWKNMFLLNSLGFHTMMPIAFGEKKRLGIPYFSLTLTENIYDTEKLEVYLPKKFSPPLTSIKIIEKRELIKKLALLARDFHNKGLNHQDFYLGHLFIRPKDGRIFIIDIQRVHYKKSIRKSDKIKDLAQLAFSAKGINIFTRTDYIRFLHVYCNRERLTIADRRFMKKIIAKKKRIEKHTAKMLAKRKANKWIYP